MGNTNPKLPAFSQQRQFHTGGKAPILKFGQPPGKKANILSRDTFHAMLTLERRRAERSRKPFVLMLVDFRSLYLNGNTPLFVDHLTSVICAATRETDIVGWYEETAILAVIFTETNIESQTSITEVLHSKVMGALSENFDSLVASKITVTAHLFPESCDLENPDRITDAKLYPDLSHQVSAKRGPRLLKRVMDIVGSGLLLLVLSPILGAVALLIKLTSKGPVIFEQERLGQFGKRFKIRKFRTMYVDNDSKIHREYVQSFITGKGKAEKDDDANIVEPAVYKITDDPRVTPVGKFLRKTSLDEFPQFWNVVRGEMSLVGPRPPLPYEFEVYDLWHRRRVLEVKPGVTGLWQVMGRSRTCFDDMVRLDLRYSQHWSIWLDLKILLATPRAVFLGDGAF